MTGIVASALQLLAFPTTTPSIIDFVLLEKPILRCTSMITMTAIPDRILLSYRDPESFECNARFMQVEQHTVNYTTGTK